MKFNAVKWKLMLTTLPVTLLILTIKYVLVSYVGYDGIVKYSEVSLVVTGGIFLIGFMLAGTMSDYKESEKLPAILACAFESIEDTLRLCHQYRGGFDYRRFKADLHTIAETIYAWIQGGRSEQEVFGAIDGITGISLELERAGLGNIAARITGEQHQIRKVVTRINVIRKTGFLATGYAFLEVLTVVVIALLLVSQFENLLICMIVVSFVSHIYVYMVRLIRDIDQPFDYVDNGVAGAAEIDLFPLSDYLVRAGARLEEDDTDEATIRVIAS